MNVILSALVLLSFAAGTPALAAVDGREAPLVEQAWRPEEPWNDTPVRASHGALRADTTWYGQYEVIGGQYYAIGFDNKQQGSWTFDRGIGPFDPPLGVIPNGEGFSVRDLTADIAAYFRAIDGSLNLGIGVPPPILSGMRSLWVGADKPEADALCWPCGPGYGNNWCQRIVSPALAYDGTGDVTLSFLYWSNAEVCYDGTQVYLRRADATELMLNPYPAGACWNNTAYEGGTFTDSIGHYTNPQTYTRVITAAEIGGAQEIRVLFEFASDGGWADDDCQYATIWGPFGADDIAITGGGIDLSCDFETGLQGWTPGICDPIGDFADIVDVGAYTILDPCQCRLSANILELHDGIGDAGVHPEGQYVRISSPICWFGSSDPKTIFMELEMYADMPLANGVLIRPGWRYYPWTCAVTGEVGWSPRVGQSASWTPPTEPICTTWRFGGTTIYWGGSPIPRDALGAIALIDLLADCEAFSISPCSGVTNPTPLIDNITVGTTPSVRAPAISFDNGTQYQDVGSFPSSLFDPRASGPANITRDLRLDTPIGAARDLCGDTLVVRGPAPTADPNTRWEAQLWWRVEKRGPFQADREMGASTRYKIWKDRVSDGLPIDRPDRPAFTMGRMDSCQVWYFVLRDRFCSEFREDDDDFVGERHPENEMIWDDALRPGTRIEYFVTANFTNTPAERSYLPDTTGGFFYEFEILPGLMTARVPDCGGAGFDHCVFQPATLYIDAYNRGAQVYIENALRTVLNGLDPCRAEAGCKIPHDRAWDRYDYLDAFSNWNAPFVRGSVPGSNNGMTLSQILGYRTILLNTGTFGGGGMQDEDFELFRQWLVSPECSANANRQVFIMNGDKTGELLERPGGVQIPGYGLAFLTNTLGAALLCNSFNGIGDDPDCAPENHSYCLRWLPVPGGPYGTETDIDAWGNSCPNRYGFNVLSANGGQGNRFYRAEDGLKQAEFAQVVRTEESPGNFRTVLDGVSWHHLTSREPGGTGESLCPRATESIVEAAIREIGAALKWGYGVSDYAAIPRFTSARALAACQGTWNLPTAAEDVEVSTPVNRLYQNQPNPFNPRTTIPFSLARPGAVKVVIYDVNGRVVRTLIDGVRDAGPNMVEWDGTDDAGRRVGSGIFWSQMTTGSFTSNKKLVILK